MQAPTPDAPPRDSGPSVSTPLMPPLQEVIRQDMQAEGGWWPFDRFMSAALYTPGLGYYNRPSLPIGSWPEQGSDFVTAPELSPLFGAALSVQVAQALAETGTGLVFEFGAGTGALAEQVIQALGTELKGYRIVELSGHLRALQAQRLARFGDRVQWLDALPEGIEAVVLGNEVLDAMPVSLLHWDGQAWWERGVGLSATESGFVWVDRPTTLRPPVDGQRPSADQDARMDWPARFVPGTVVEIHPQAEAFIATLASRLKRGAAFFIDYGFPEREYYHPQRTGGTVMCHRLHRSDPDPLVEVGLKDITAHVNFTAMALAAQDAGLAVLGYTSQARFLMNCGLVDRMAEADVAERAQAAKLITEHEMGELFKVLGLAAGEGFEALGFAAGDRSHTL